MKNAFLLLCMAVIIGACSTTTTDTSSDGSSETIQEEKLSDGFVENENTICLYFHHDDSVKVHWVAYKHTKKAPVHGDFDSVFVIAKEPARNVRDMLASAEFRIKTASTNTKDITRDQKLVEQFFGKMKESEWITGKVMALEGENSGMATVNIRMNGIDKTVKMSFAIEATKIQLEGIINVLDWQAKEALSALNKVCLERHTGDDGVSKLWDEVKLVINTTVDKDCK